MLSRTAVVVAVLLTPLWTPGVAHAGGDAKVRVDRAGTVGSFTSIALAADGNPVVSYYDEASGDLKIARCGPKCRRGTTISAPDTEGFVGLHSSLVLDGNGNPVVSYSSILTGDLKLLHCNDPACIGADESITSPDTTGVVGTFTSLALDASGFPVVSYHDSTNGNLKVLHCDDPNCAGGDESITTPDGTDVVGTFSSLVLDAYGFPVVSYLDSTNGDLKVLHCNDPACAGGDETITSADTVGDVGHYTSLVLDSSGKPVISYYDNTNGDLKLLHCNDVDCAASNVPRTLDSGGDVGTYSSLILDRAADGPGFPMVSYHDFTNRDLKFVYCSADASCAFTAQNSITTPDRRGSVGEHTSLVQTSDGLPVVSYYDSSNGDLKVLFCNDDRCA